VIRFSASLVVVGVGLLIAGGVTSKLLLIYVAIGVSAVALLFLIVGAILHRAELFGREPEGIAAGHAGHDGYADEVGAKPEPAVSAAAAPAAAAAGQGPERREARPASAKGTGAAPNTGTIGNTGSQPLHTFAGYEQFTTQAERRRPEPPREDRPSRPSQPSRPARSQPPFVDPQPTRMDWAADLRKAEKQELERQEQERQGQTQRPGRPDVPAQDRPERGRPDRSQPARPFVDPEPTRMDWAKNLREAEKRELGRQASEHETRPASPSPARPSSPPRPPAPAPAEATRAERIQQPAQSAEATRAERIQPPAEAKPSTPAAQATRAERIQPPTDATRAEKIITAKPDDNTPAAKDQPPAAGASAATQEPAAEAEDQKPAAAKASAAPPKEDQEPAADSSPADAATETKSPAEPATETNSPAEPADSDAPEPSQAQETSDRGGDTSRDGVPSDQDVTVVPGVPRYHRSECILIRFMGDNDLQRMPVEQARKAGCTPCRACQPDGEEDDGPLDD
jgi:hypothetical protein